MVEEKALKDVANKLLQLVKKAEPKAEAPKPDPAAPPPEAAAEDPDAPKKSDFWS